MGFGIAAMHYVGMDAMRLPATCHYSHGLVELSVLLAIGISLIALWLTFHLRAETNSMSWRKLVSAMVMGLAIPVMHYTGMAAASFRYSAAPGRPNQLHRNFFYRHRWYRWRHLHGSLSGDPDIHWSTVAFPRSPWNCNKASNDIGNWWIRLKSSCGGPDRLQQLQLCQSRSRRSSWLSNPEWTRKPAFWADHLHPEDRAIGGVVLSDSRGRPRGQRFEHRMVAADGRVVWLRTSVRLVSGNGQSKEIAGAMTDITDRKLAQEAAEQASRTKSWLLAEINGLHDRLKQENTRMGSELEITQRLQQMMLPRDEDMGKIAGLDISGSMEPAAEVGGDYYDVVVCEDGGVFFAIGDVTGHGLESGVIAIMVQTAVRTLLASGQYESKKVFKRLNRVVYDNVRRMRCDRNLTLSLLHYQDKVVTISGQHEEVLVVRGNGAPRKIRHS